MGRGADALTLLGPHLRVAERYENAALLATLNMLLADALFIEGRRADAQSVRLDSLGWARYGYGVDWVDRPGFAKRSIATLSGDESG